MEKIRPTHHFIQSKIFLDLNFLFFFFKQIVYTLQWNDRVDWMMKMLWKIRF